MEAKDQDYLRDSAELVQVLVPRPETWQSSLVSAPEGVLPPRERLALPGVPNKQFAWLVGGATMEHAGQFEGVAQCHAWQAHLAALREAVGTDDFDLIVALGESTSARWPMRGFRGGGAARPPL